MAKQACAHLTAIHDVKQPKQPRLRRVREVRRQVGASANVPDLRPDVVLRQFTQPPCQFACGNECSRSDCIR